MRHYILTARRVVFRKERKRNRLLSVGEFSHFSFLFRITFFFFTFSVFLSDRKPSPQFFPLAFWRESILREAVFLFRPLCLFIFFSSIPRNVKHTIICLSLPYPCQLPFSEFFPFSQPSLSLSD